MPRQHDDLASFIRAYEAARPTEVWRVADEVSTDCVPTAYALELERQRSSPLLVFERLHGHDIPVVSNVFATRERIAFAVGVEEAALQDHWTMALRDFVKPVLVSDGPVLEVVEKGPALDATRLPILRHFAQDAGRYVTAALFVTKDPDTGVRNLSYHRMQLKGPDRFGTSLHTRAHMWDYYERAERKGKPLEAAVVVGAHPSIYLAGASRVGIDVDEYDIAGALMGRPVELVKCATIDVEVPANAEIVLEGELLLNVREPEGPFGEYTGYMTDRSTLHVFAVRAISRRRQPIYLDIVPGFSNDHLLLAKVQREAVRLVKLREVMPNVRALHYPKSSANYHCFISMRKVFEGQPQQAAMMLFGLDPYAKLVVVVDEDVDVTDEDEVWWAVATRSQPNEDTFLVPKSFCHLLDPSSKDGTGGKLAIDATIPFDWKYERHALPEAAVQAARRAILTLGKPL